MATVLECTIEEKRSVVRFLYAKGLNVEDVHKEIFPVYGGKCLSRKAVHNWVEIFSQRFADDEEVETEVREWLRRQSKDFYIAGFNALVKPWDKCINVAGRYVEKRFLFQVRISHILRFISISDLFTDTPSYLLTSKETQGKLFTLSQVLELHGRSIDNCS
jgi:hypothetical protein